MPKYIGVNGVAREVTKQYIGVNGVARKITESYIGVNGVARRYFWSPITDHSIQVLSFRNLYDYTNNTLDPTGLYVGAICDFNYYYDIDKNIKYGSSCIFFDISSGIAANLYIVFNDLTYKAGDIIRVEVSTEIDTSIDHNNKFTWDADGTCSDIKVHTTAIIGYRDPTNPTDHIMLTTKDTLTNSKYTCFTEVSYTSNGAEIGNNIVVGMTVRTESGYQTPIPNFNSLTVYYNNELILDWT